MMKIDNRLDPINTQLINPPGAWSAPYKFGTFKELPGELWESQDPSPMCELAQTAGDKTVDWCFPRKPNCPMTRELEPSQHVDADTTYGYVVTAVAPRVKKPKKKIVSDDDVNLIMKFALILIFIIILITLSSKF
jgi:hypothetical protein